MKILKKTIVMFLKQLDLGSAVAVRLTKLTGKSKVAIHPKHIVNQTPWFVKYLQKRDKVLDLGCGNGQNTIKAAKKVKQIIGADFDQKSLDIARISAKLKKIMNVKFETANLETKLRYKDSQFSKVILLDVLEHLRKRDLILGEIKRILKKDGFLILGVPNSQTSWKKLQRSVGLNSFSDPDHKIEYSENSLKSILNKNGFKIIHFGYGKYDTPLRGLFDVIGAFSIPIYELTLAWRSKLVAKNHKEASGFEVVAIKK